MSNLPEARNDIELQEVAFRASVSQATFTKFGQAVNFINRRQYDSHPWNFNGRYALGQGVLGSDAFFPCLFDMEILGVSFFNRKAGTSGTLEFEIERYTDANTSAGSIFSTTPKIDSTAVDFTYGVYDKLNNATVKTATGVIIPVITTVDLDAGDMLVCKLQDTMSDAEDCSIIIHYRPR